MPGLLRHAPPHVHALRPREDRREALGPARGRGSPLHRLPLRPPRRLPLRGPGRPPAPRRRRRPRREDRRGPHQSPRPQRPRLPRRGHAPEAPARVQRQPAAVRRRRGARPLRGPRSGAREVDPRGTGLRPDGPAVRPLLRPLRRPRHAHPQPRGDGVRRHDGEGGARGAVPAAPGAGGGGEGHRPPRGEPPIRGRREGLGGARGGHGPPPGTVDRRQRAPHGPPPPPPWPPDGDGIRARPGDPRQRLPPPPPPPPRAPPRGGGPPPPAGPSPSPTAWGFAAPGSSPGSPAPSRRTSPSRRPSASPRPSSGTPRGS